MVTQWGQFLDHDITLTPETHAEDCCSADTENEDCFPINIPSVDAFYSTYSVKCLEFTRSTGFCEEEEDEEEHERADDGTEHEHHEQINGSYSIHNILINELFFYLIPKYYRSSLISIFSYYCVC